MSLIRINVTDKESVLTGDLHCSDAERLVASLTAEPDTIEELKYAFKRFSRDDLEETPFAWFRRSALASPLDFQIEINFDSVDSGIMVIDLAGRTIGCESSRLSPSLEGTIGVIDRLSNDPFTPEFPLPYRLSEDWRIVSSIAKFENIATKRRKSRLNSKPLDARKILFGEPMLRFIAVEMGKSRIPENEKFRAHLHGLWLLGEREDLNGMSPREVLLDKREFISADLNSRSLQWSFSKDEPPNLRRDSAAFRNSGFGTHEIVVYYDLIRHLMEIFGDRLKQTETAENGVAIKALEEAMKVWMEEPNAEYSGRIPSEIIECERMRKNITISPEECVVDEDCPICIEMSQIFDTPMFWHLDGSHMDREFAFSFHKTYEEWQKEELAFESFMKREIVSSEDGDFEDVESFIREMKF